MKYIYIYHEIYDIYPFIYHGIYEKEEAETSLRVETI